MSFEAPPPRPADPAEVPKSVLFGWPRSEDASEWSAFFRDLNLDYLMQDAAAGSEAYDIEPFFHLPLLSLDHVAYRHEVFRDLEDDRLLRGIEAFTKRIATVRHQNAQVKKLTYSGERQTAFLAAVESYCGSVLAFSRALSRASPQSRGLQAVRDYFRAYARSSAFSVLRDEANRLRRDLRAIRYRIVINADGLEVKPFEDFPDYSAEIEKDFGRFHQGDANDYRVSFSEERSWNHVEAKVFEFVSELYPDVFSRLAEYYERSSTFLDPTILVFEREVQFYIAYIRCMRSLESCGLRFCYPEITNRDKEVSAFQAFDIALALKLRDQNSEIVCNNFSLSGAERILVVTGPNQGGKTTFARMLGQLHYLAAVGCPVPGDKARLFLCDTIFTHFEKQEPAESLTGKLQDDLVRLRDILDRAGSRSLVILNEIFTSTTLSDAKLLSQTVMRRLVRLGSLAVWVTFIDELATFGEPTVSMVATVDTEDPTRRSFEIVRRPPDGLSRALAIAAKYGATYTQLRKRLQP